MTEPTTHAGFVALVGAPNAGKSTLLNQMVGEKVSIVTPKVQTTRARITAIAMVDETQVVFVDTPGIFRPRRRLDEAMVGAAWTGATDADVTVLLIDAARGLNDNVIEILDRFEELGQKIWVALNKVDLIRKDQLLAMTAELSQRPAIEEFYMISALNGDGVDDLRSALAKRMPVGPYMYPEDQVTDIPNRLMAAEVTREKLFLRLHQELPYGLTVETESWDEKRDGSIRISQVIYIARANHKSMVLGKGGRQIKEVGKLAREELSEIYGCTIHLFLFVKVREKWLDDPERFREMGLDFPG